MVFVNVAIVVGRENEILRREWEKKKKIGKKEVVIGA